MGDRHTYQIKILVKDHTCGRVTKNRSAKSKWVANFVVVNKLQTNEKVTIKDIMKDMRKNYSVDITKGMAWKATQIAKRIVDGDANRQYSMVWRYAAELTRVCPGNTADAAYLRISKVSIYVSSPQGLVRYPGLLDVNYHFKFDR